MSVRLPSRVAEHGMERFEAIHWDYVPFDRCDRVKGLWDCMGILFMELKRGQI